MKYVYDVIENNCKYSIINVDTKEILLNNINKENVNNIA